jgi:hypothetical protein
MELGERSPGSAKECKTLSGLDESARGWANADGTARRVNTTVSEVSEIRSDPMGLM